jgi:DNA-binding MarR family transcriptional regulator
MDTTITQRFSDRTLSVLATIEHSPGPITSRAISERTGLDRTTLSPIITRLLAEGIITRVSRGIYVWAS